MSACISDVLGGLAPWCVVEGDCLPVLASMPDKSVAHVITDPPYEAEAHTKQRRTLKDGTRKSGAINRGDVRWFDPVLPFSAIGSSERTESARQWARVAARWVISFCQIEAISAWRVAMIDGGLEWIRGGIWHKPDGMPQFTGDRPGQGFESIAIAHTHGKKRWNGGGRHAFWSVGLEHGRGGGGRNEHPTKKPVDLMIRLVTDFTDLSDIVLDPFAGSGTTGVAAIRLGRRAILIEKDPKYAALCRERMEAETMGSSLNSYRAGQESLFR